MKKIVYKVTVVVLILTFSIAFLGCSKKSYLEQDNAESETTKEAKSSGESKDNNESKTVDGTCFVQVAGAVNKPGVYSLSSDARICHAIDMAGGLRADADDSSLNQAEKITDGLKIVVKTQDETNALVAEQGNDSGKVNINTADEKTLMTLPGVGESKAKAIIKYRESKGTFSKPEDLKNITGIKDGVYNKIADSITV